MLETAVLTVKSTLRKSFRKKPASKLDYFPFEKLPENIKIKVLQNLSPIDVINFASTSSDSEKLVAENRKVLPRFEFDRLIICYDPKENNVCLRCQSSTKTVVSSLNCSPLSYRF